ncbi:MAG: hypothetical protein IPK98_18480 [Chloracidobacterium sp.]|nr:hypothetical protein [Chloracidobacterium sp.]
MGLFDTIRQPFLKKKLRKEQLEALNSTLWRAIADGKITDEELGEINGYFYDSELTTEEIQKAQADVFSQLVYQAIADRRVSDEEFRSLEHIADRFSLSDQTRQWMQQQIQYFRVFNHIEAGGDLPSVIPGSVIMQKNEICHLSVPGILYEERVVRSTYQGGSRGVSLRVMKGVSFRVGAHRGQIQSERALVPVSQGVFNVTNQRLVFSGDAKSNSTAYPKLLDFQVYADAIQYSITSRQKPVIVGFPTIENAELSALVISRLLNS